MFNFLDETSSERINLNENIFNSIYQRALDPLDFNNHKDDYNYENHFDEFFHNDSIMLKTNSNVNITINKKLSGRKRKREIKEGGKTHNKFAHDNIIRKINVGFLNFLIKFINAILNKLNINGKFEEINGTFKKKIKIKEIEEWKKYTVKKLLTLDINKKFHDQKKNYELFKTIFENDNYNNKILDNLKSKKYIEIFKEHYYINEKFINYDGLELELPMTFGDFLEKKAEKNSLYKQKINEVIKKYFIPSIPNIFVCEKMEKII